MRAAWRRWTDVSTSQERRALEQLRAALQSKLQRAEHAVAMAEAALADSKAFRLGKRRDELVAEMAHNDTVAASSKKVRAPPRVTDAEGARRWLRLRRGSRPSRPTRATSRHAR